MRCTDFENVVHPYVDGELVGEDCVAVEHHVAECDACRARLAFHTRFKADLRARLRSSFARPEPPSRLLENVRAALDRADVRGEGPVPKVVSRALPYSAGVLAAAATLFLIFRPVSNADSPLVEEAIRGHEKNLPLEIGGPRVNDDEIRTWFGGKVDVPVRPPRGVATRASLEGARVYHLRNRDVGQIRYRLNGGGSQVTVFVFDPSGVELTAPVRRTVGRHEVFIAEERGYSVVIYSDRGVGYAFTSDVAGDELMQMVAASLRD